MKFITDFHIHSHYSIATSKNLIPEYLEYWARLKGIDVIGTGDCIHPGWSRELREKLQPLDNGLYRLKDEYRLEESKRLSADNIPGQVSFMLTGEISNIYKKDGRVRKVHNLCVFPDFEALEKVQGKLDLMGNITSDGRPILGLDSKILLEMVLESAEKSFLIPAHIWTPWFSALGSKSGFDTIEECYEELTGHIFAVETGLSSDPAMNWACSFLDRFRLVSNSDAHSPEKLGREANLFNTEISYESIYNSLKDDRGFLGTIEFFPQEGKYHYDGHRKCEVCWDPVETLENSGICPVCGKNVTRGVMYRVAELADRADILEAPGRKDFSSITQLPDLLAEILGHKSSKSKAVDREYFRLIDNIGSEFYMLLDAGGDELERGGSEMLAEGIGRLRRGDVIIEEGYDGEFGRIRVFEESELKNYSGTSLFGTGEKRSNNNKRLSIHFDIATFKKMMKDIHERIDQPLEPGETKKSYKTETVGEPSALTERQREGVEFSGGPSIVLAGPGTGKTWMLIQRIIHLVENKGADPASILAVTFSNRAAREMRERLDSHMAGSAAAISTLHALGLSIIKIYYNTLGFTEDFSIIDDDEKYEILSAIVSDKKKIKKYSKDIELIKQGALTSDNNELFEVYNKQLREKNFLDLGDLIYLPVILLNEHPEIAELYQKKYPHILVDEFQDINPRQFEFIRHLAGDKKPDLFLIGDPNQAIYGFRGAHRRIFHTVKELYPAIKIISLDKSFRCPRNILKAGVQVLQSGEILAGSSDEIGVEIFEMKTDRSEADWIAASIEKMMGGVRSFSIDSGISDGEAHTPDTGFKDFAVLCRSSFMFASIIEAFQNHGIPCHTVGRDSILNEKPLRPIIRSLGRLFYQGEDPDISDEIAYDVIQMMKKKDSVADVLKFMMVIGDVDNDTMDRAYRIAENYNGRYSEFFRNSALRIGADDFDPETEAVKLMTIHGSKGLEFNTVFIPGCEDSIIPFTLFGRKSPEEIDEEERLLYVAITRTKSRLFISHAKSRLYRGRVLKQKRSPFLDRIEEELLKHGKRKERRKKDDEMQLDLFS